MAWAAAHENRPRCSPNTTLPSAGIVCAPQIHQARQRHKSLPGFGFPQPQEGRELRSAQRHAHRTGFAVTVRSAAPAGRVPALWVSTCTLERSGIGITGAEP